jgi:hypothetical protein
MLLPPLQHPSFSRATTDTPQSLKLTAKCYAGIASYGELWGAPRVSPVKETANPTQSPAMSRASALPTLAISLALLFPTMSNRFYT